MKFAIKCGAAVLFATTAISPAMAEIDKTTTFDGPYISIVGGQSGQPSDRRESILFDTDRDGQYDENVLTVAGANAFTPGFCGGSAKGNNAGAGCNNDNDDWEYYARVGVDKRMGNFVLGGLIEGGRSEATDSVTAFSSTPASYTMTRETDYELSARLRAGYTPNGGVLFYVTGGGAYAKMDNSFTTTNGANAFANNGKTNAWGYQVGGGAEAMVAQNLSLGLEYMYTSLADDDFVVNVTQGTAAATNPFLLNGGGTNFNRSDEDFNRHSVRVTASLRF